MTNTPLCKDCHIPMKRGIIMGNTHVSSGDAPYFHPFEDGATITQSAISRGLARCWKCPNCGHSFAKRESETTTIRLGELIEQLKRQPPDNNISFDFMGFSPREINSWRGDYSELALGYDGEYGVTVKDILEQCEMALIREFDGYKGGEYKMSPNTRVWVGNWGEYHNYTGISGVETISDHMTVIHTKHMEYEFE